MFTNAQVLEAARCIRSRLRQAQESEISQESAQTIEQQLALLLNQPDLDENSCCDRLLDVLESNPKTQAWLEDFLNNGAVQRSYSGLAGDPALQPATKYVCPIANDYTQYREGLEAIELCPTHLVPLVLAQS